MRTGKQQGFNLWFGLMIIGPAILLLGLLWNSWGKNTNEQPITYALPEQILSSGSVFSCPEGEYNFFPAILTDEFSTANSINLAGAGSVYLWLPALIPASAPDDLPFYLLDNRGLRSEPFRSYPSDEFTLPQELPEITVPTGQKLIYTLFKVSKAAAEFYLIGTFQGEEAAWPLPFSA